MSNLVTLFVCLLAGRLLGAYRGLPENAPATINGYIIHVALPALILARVHGFHLSRVILWPVLMPWILLGLSAALLPSSDAPPD